jgi:hypothetical protein
MGVRTLAAVVLLAAASARAEEVALSKIERSIAKEPTYNCKEPRYALAVFGPQAKTRMWLVLDKSKPDAKRYDLLYADLNANGDLTEKEERIADANPASAPEGSFKLPDFADPVSKDKHTDVRLSVSDKRSVNLLSMRWQGKHKLGGGYPVDGSGGYMDFAATAQEAPILWFNGEGPFRFQRWIDEKCKIGDETDIRLFLGNPGLGKNTFCAFQEHVLPAEEGVQAALIYQDADGKERRAVCELKERC